MKLLIDTHILLWATNADPQLEQAAIDLIEDPTTELLLSMASVWEMAIKINLGKLQLVSHSKTSLKTPLNTTA